jgi:hypothetical protein
MQGHSTVNGFKNQQWTAFFIHSSLNVFHLNWPYEELKQSITVAKKIPTELEPGVQPAPIK